MKWGVMAPGWLLLLAGLALPAAAQEPAVVIPGESRATALRLAEAQKHAAEHHWAEALDELQSVLDTTPSDLVAVDARRSMQARRLAHAAIAALPAAALRLYRTRVDARAARWLEQGLAEKDSRLLRKVVEDTFCSRPAEKALNILGDHAFERGRYDEALAWWRLLVPALTDGVAGGSAGALHYPDPTVDPARIRAKQLLARLFRDGRTPAWESDLAMYRTSHAKAEGTLAGRAGCYADTLLHVAAQRDKDDLADPDWATFGGDACRGLVVPAAGDVLDQLAALCRDGPAWRFSLQTHQPLEGPPPPLVSGDRGMISLAALARTLAFHPVLTRNEVLVADSRRITAFDLREGKAHTWYDAGRDEEGLPVVRLPAPAGLRYTLSTADGKLFARLGGPISRAPQRAEEGAGQGRDENDLSLITCLALRSADAAEHLRWRVRSVPAAGARHDPAFFEGTPLAEGSHVVVAHTHLSGQRAITSMECYGTDSAAADLAPPLRWRRDICEAREPRPDQPRYPHLLTRAGSVLAYCSHSGVIVALEPASGQMIWALRYPHRPETNDRLLETVPTPEQQARARDLAPCLFADGRLYAAPADSDILLCLDPATGAVLWEREQTHVVHLLGVGQGRLIFQTMTGLRAVGAADGSDAGGWLQPTIDPLSAPGCPSMGRGLLIGDLVLWPTAIPRHSGPPTFMVHAIRQADGTLAGDPTLLHRLPVGNLAYAHGCLAVAEQTTLSVFVPPRLRLDERRGAVFRDPTSALAWLDVARSEADAGHFTAAQQAFRQTEQLAGELADKRQARHLLQEARIGLQAALLQSARRAIVTGTAPAERMLSEAAGLDVPDPCRLRTLWAIAEIYKAQDQPERALASLEQILASPPLRSLPLREARGFAEPAAIRVAAEARLLAAAHEELARDVERRAHACWDNIPAKDRVEAAQRLADEFPHARWTPSTLREVALELEKAHRPWAAAGVWRRLRELAVEQEDRSAARDGLARCRKQPRHTQDNTATAEVNPTPAQSGLAFPLRRAWHAALAADEVFLAGMDPAACGPLVLTRRGDAEVIARRFANGEIAWQARLPFQPGWMSGYADLILTGGAAGAAALRREDGGLTWTFSPAGVPLLSGFRACGGRLFMLEDRCRLDALDAETGKVLWASEAPGARLGMPEGTFLAAYEAGPQAILVQLGSGRFRLLHAVSGQLLAEGPATPLSRIDAPVALDPRTIAMVPTAQQVLALALPAGTNGSHAPLWQYDLPGSTISTGELPRIFACGEALLLATPLNIGVRLDRLELRSGKVVWEHPCLLPLSRLEDCGWAVDPTAVYYAGDGVLCARALQDGRLLWQRPLPAPGPWVVRCAGESLLVYPDPRPRTYLRFRWGMASLQYLAGPPIAGEASLGILVCDRQTGQLSQRLNLPFRPRGGARLNKDGAMVVWIHSTAEPAADPGAENVGVYLGRGGAVVALAGELWGLAGDRP